VKNEGNKASRRLDEHWCTSTVGLPHTRTNISGGTHHQEKGKRGKEDKAGEVEVMEAEKTQ